jgi:hypothetical protein
MKDCCKLLGKLIILQKKYEEESKLNDRILKLGYGEVVDYRELEKIKNDIKELEKQFMERE